MTGSSEALGEVSSERKIELTRFALSLRTGASLAYQLTRPGAAGEGKTILLLEAKDVASGASSFIFASKSLQSSSVLTSQPSSSRFVSSIQLDETEVISHQQLPTPTHLSSPRSQKEVLVFLPSKLSRSSSPSEKTTSSLRRSVRRKGWSTRLICTVVRVSGVSFASFCSYAGRRGVEKLEEDDDDASS